jgi:GNAT superfamily N-acetyltransferase
VHINPTGLDWRRFVVAVDGSGRLLGGGQIKPHGDGTRELASIAVWPEYRGQGIARAVIEYLLEHNPPPLYLTCRTPLEALYSKFGFTPLADGQMTPYFRRLSRAFGVLARIFPHRIGLSVMRWDG